VKRSIRLTRSTDFQRVRRFGKSYAHPLLVLIVSPNELGFSRFGVAAGRSIGNAVKRNRTKRLLREAIRKQLSSVSSGWDVLVIGRKPVVQASYDQVCKALIDLMDRADLLQGNN